jgi:phage shock protein PspC (stress-responsive transcriptional regulator)
MPKRLYRSRTDRMLFGVAGGFAEYLDMDPALVRIIWALLILAGGVGFLLYIVAAIVIPEAPYGYPAGGPTGPPGPADAGIASGDPAAPGAAGAPAPNAMPGQSAWVTDHGQRHRDGNGALVLGGLLVIVGGWFLFRDLLPGFDDRFVGPGLLVVVGLFLVLGAMRRR